MCGTRGTTKDTLYGGSVSLFSRTLDTTPQRRVRADELVDRSKHRGASCKVLPQTASRPSVDFRETRAWKRAYNAQLRQRSIQSSATRDVKRPQLCFTLFQPQCTSQLSETHLLQQQREQQQQSSYCPSSEMPPTLQMEGQRTRFAWPADGPAPPADIGNNESSVDTSKVTQLQQQHQQQPQQPPWQQRRPQQQQCCYPDSPLLDEPGSEATGRLSVSQTGQDLQENELWQSAGQPQGHGDAIDCDTCADCFSGSEGFPIWNLGVAGAGNSLTAMRFLERDKSMAALHASAPTATTSPEGCGASNNNKAYDMQNIGASLPVQRGPAKLETAGLQQQHQQQPPGVSRGQISSIKMPPGTVLAQPSIAAHQSDAVLHGSAFNGSVEQQYPVPCGLHQTGTKQMQRHPPLGQSWGGHQSAPVLPWDADVTDTCCYLSPQPGSGDSAAGDARSQPGFDASQLHMADSRPSAPSKYKSGKTKDPTSAMHPTFIDAHGCCFAEHAANCNGDSGRWTAPQDLPLHSVRPGCAPMATESRSFVHALPVADCTLARYSALAAAQATDNASVSTAPWRNAAVGGACTESQNPPPQRSPCVPSVPPCVQTQAAESGDAWPHLLDDLERALEDSDSDGELPPWPHEM